MLSSSSPIPIRGTALSLVLAWSCGCSLEVPRAQDDPEQLLLGCFQIAEFRLQEGGLDLVWLVSLLPLWLPLIQLSG